MRTKIKVMTVTIANTTKQQLEDAINAQLLKGWRFVTIFINGTNWWIILSKEVSA